MGSRAVVTSLALAAVLGGCGSPTSSSTSVVRVLAGEATSDDEAARAFVVAGIALPEAPASVDPDDPALEPVVRASNELSSREAPIADGVTDGTPSEIAEPLVRYLDAQGQALRALWEATQRLSTRSLGAHVVARAIAGATLAAFAERLASLPLPSSERGDAARFATVRERLSRVAQLVRERAIEALGACAETAVGSADPTLEAWRRFCDEQAARTTQQLRP